MVYSERLWLVASDLVENPGLVDFTQESIPINTSDKACKICYKSEDLRSSHAAYIILGIGFVTPPIEARFQKMKFAIFKKIKVLPVTFYFTNDCRTSVFRILNAHSKFSSIPGFHCKLNHPLVIRKETQGWF